MDSQQGAPQKPEPTPRQRTWVFWVTLGIAIAITLALMGLIIWLATTQNLDKLYTKLGIVASIVVIVTTPLIFFFAVVKRPETRVPKEEQTSITPLYPEKPLAIWNVPYRRNSFFTGREELLQQLHDNLTKNKTAALTGLGGIGKTQTAIEYAYRYRNDYHYVLWANAHSHEILLSDLVTLAGVLQLPEKAVPDQGLVVAAVKRWLEGQTDWLLIFDNADDLSMVSDFLPSVGQGHIVLTTRAQATEPLAKGLGLEQMGQEEGAVFLLRRAVLIDKQASLSRASPENQHIAKDIAVLLGGLPLALDQAGAYIYETGCGLSGYMELYHTEQSVLLQERGAFDSEHPEPVAKTWSLSFAKVEQANPAAAELLRLCAFLYPDAIPLEVITKGADELGAVLQPVAKSRLKLNAAVRELLKYSLVRRDPNTKLLSVHRLVQMVLQHVMEQETQRQWAERAVRAVNQTFPDATDYRNWSLCQQYLPHALVCATWIDTCEFAFPEAGRLLNRVGYYLVDRAALYAEAEPLYQRAIAIGEKTLGPEHPDLAIKLNNLAILYAKQGKYAEAEPLYQRAIAIGEKTLGPEHPDLATRLNNLANLYANQDKYAEAEPLYQRAIAIGEKTLGPEHPDLATSLNNLATFYAKQGKYAEAEPLYQRAIAIDEKELGSEHPGLAIDLSNLAQLYTDQSKYAEAEPLYQRALAICKQKLGPDHPTTRAIREDYIHLLGKMK